MTCETSGERTLLLSLGLFGVPAEQAECDRDVRTAHESDRADPEENGSTR